MTRSRKLVHSNKIKRETDHYLSMTDCCCCMWCCCWAKASENELLLWKLGLSNSASRLGAQPTGFEWTGSSGSSSLRSPRSRSGDARLGVAWLPLLLLWAPRSRNRAKNDSRSAAPLAPRASSEPWLPPKSVRLLNPPPPPSLPLRLPLELAGLETAAEPLEPPVVPLPPGVCHNAKKENVYYLLRI